MEIEKEQELIRKFISSIEGQYGGIEIEYSYNEELNLHDIYHNNKNFQFENREFLNFVGLKLKELLYDKGLHNVSFGYDYDRYVY